MKIILCERALEWTIKEPPFGVRGININKIKSSIQTKDKLKKRKINLWTIKGTKY